jgi:hypothetical protein
MFEILVKSRNKKSNSNRKKNVATKRRKKRGKTNL